MLTADGLVKLNSHIWQELTLKYYSVSTFEIYAAASKSSFPSH